MGFNQDLLNDIAGVGSLFSGTILRDYTHASKVFRTNSYENAPKLKFLFHTYFELNVDVGDQTNFGVLVKEVKLPTFSLTTSQMNQYNRKRIVQTKIKYDPIEISFHDDNGNQVTKLWEAYYQYYYNDSVKVGSVLQGPGATAAGTGDYNSRNIYNTSISGDDDWGFSGGQTDSATGSKKPFFKNITIFGFNQHNFTAYTLVNPVITNFSHDTYNYSEGSGTMTNRMTIDYETVIYNYGAMDGRTPGNIVKSFGDAANYDTLPSPIVGEGQGKILGKGGLIDAAGGFIESVKRGNIVGAVANAMSVVNTASQLAAPATGPGTNPANNAGAGKDSTTALLRVSVENTPENRNALFNVPVAGSSPGPAGLGGSLTVSALTTPKTIDRDAVATGLDGNQYSASTVTGKIIAPDLSPLSTSQPYSEVITVKAGSQYSGTNLSYPLVGLPAEPPFPG